MCEMDCGKSKGVQLILTCKTPLVKECHRCKRAFEEVERKHHCRSCGEGFCQACSTHSMPVPEKGWGSSPVRVCDACYQQGGAPQTIQGENARLSEEIKCSVERLLLLKHCLVVYCSGIVYCSDSTKAAI